MAIGRRKLSAYEKFLLSDAVKSDFSTIESELNANAEQLKMWNMRYKEQMTFEQIAAMLYLDERKVSTEIRRLNRQAERIIQRLRMGGEDGRL